MGASKSFFRWLPIVAASLGLAIALWSLPTTPARAVTFELKNHPDGGARPPLYGMRLDGLITGTSSEVWTFSFEPDTCAASGAGCSGGQTAQALGDADSSVNGGGIMLHARRPGGPVAAAQNCATHGPLSVATRGRRCTAWSSMRRFDWRLSTRV